VNLNISNYLKGLRITNQEDINEIVSNVENPPPISGIVGNEILWNIYFPRNEEKLFDKYELFTNKYLCEPLNENDQNVYLIKDYNYIFDENKNYKKYLLNIFSTQIYDENYFYIFYNQYVPAENYQSNKNKKKYGYKEYKLRTFVAILNLTHINDAFFETVENEEEIKIINPTILQLHDVYTCLSIDQYEDVLNGLLIHIDNCSKSKNLTKLFYLWEKDLIFNEPNLHIFDIPQTFNTSFKCPQNKIDSYMSLHFNEKNVNIVNTNFFRKIENLDTNKKYKFINMGSPHQKAFFHGYSPVSFDWKTNQIIDGFCSTIAFGFEKKSLFKLFNESENNCFSDEQFNASATLFSNLDCIQQSNMSKKNEIKNIFIFYNDSYYDKYTKKPSELDFEAIDYTKKPLFFGGEANFENIINTTSGINGIFIDFITINEDNIGINDFTFKLGNDNNLSTWTNAPLPKYFKVFDVYYDNMSLKRVCFIWENNKIQNTWLQITVKNNENTFLQQSKTFFFGHLTGLITSTIENGFFVVNNESKNTLLSYINSIINKGFVSVSNKHDISKNGIVGNEDFLTVNFISQIYNSNNYDYYKLIVLNLEENDTSLEIIKNFENETTYNFLENIPSHWHVKDEIFFNKLKNKNIEIPHVHSLFNLKNESISIFKINCPQQTEDKEILEVGYNFSTKKWKIKYKSNDLITQTEFIEKDNLFCTCENVISINCFTKNVYGCKEKKIICFDIFVNGEKLISLETFSKDFPHNLIIEHNPRSHFSGWISFWEVRKYIEEFFDCYAHLMHRFYSNIAWFSLSEEKENQNLFDEMTNKFLYKRILKIQNCNMYLPHDSIIVPLVLQGSGYDVGNHINKQIRRDVFDFSKIDLTHLDFYFTYEKTSNEISWFVEKYDIEKDLLIIWLKLDGWCGQDIIMYYGNKSVELQNNTPKKLVYDNTIWYGLWDMCNITYAYKHRFMINSLLKNNNNETFIILPENQNQYYLMSIFNNYLFNNINVYKHHYFDILIDDRFMSKENLLKFQDFVKETIRDIKPAFTELRNIDSMYDYKVEGDTNSQNTRFIDENNENVVVPYGSNLPLCNG
ncbi:MAG: hypothetical protein NZZ41_06440, partial [Candidatus Dojkabacteria bacterium]|nr:hypothetical protein [Candidatus Dojkabacteria bacterium]